MLNSLYKKLYILFTVSVMLIITFVISFAVVSAVSTDRTNESTMFQRMTTLLIYQLENTPSDMENTIRSYEEKYHLYAVIENTEGQEIYQSDFAFLRRQIYCWRIFQSRTVSSRLFRKERWTAQLRHKAEFMK